MRFLRYLLLALIAAVPLCRAGFWSTFFKHDVSVITDTDMTPDGARYPRPTPDRPTYYVAKSLGFHEFGSSMAGDKIPTEADMLKNIVKVLAKQGYLPANKAHPPSIVLLWAWGTLYPDKIESMDHPGVYQQLNRGVMLNFLGGNKLGVRQPDDLVPNILPPGLAYFDADAESIADAATDDLYVTALVAYDYQALVNKKKVILWKTKISCPGRGLALADTLPTMLAIAGPNIGKETAKPVWIDAGDQYKGQVQIGDAVFEGFVDSNKPAGKEQEKASPKNPAAKDKQQ